MFLNPLVATLITSEFKINVLDLVLKPIQRGYKQQ